MDGKTGGTRIPPGKSIWLKLSSITEQCDLRVGQQLNFAYQTIAAAKFSLAA